MTSQTLPIGKNAVPAAPANGMLLLLTLAIGFVMAMIDLTAVNVALPDISISLSVPLTGLVWVVDGYTLTFAALLLAGGALADRFGAKKVYQGGLAIFILGSVLCGIADSGNALIGARLLQGAGAALFMPSSLSLLTYAYEEERTRVKMLGMWSAMVGTASAVGPLVGGILIHQYGWRSVFWINVPIGLIGLVLAQVVIAATPAQVRGFSALSHVFGMLILSALSFFLIEGPALGWTSMPVLLSLAITVVATWMLVKRERTGKHPLLPRALFEGPGFAAVNVTGFLINFGMFGQLFLLGLYIQQARSADALHAGLQLLPIMAAITFGNLMSGRISAKLGTRMPMLIGLSVAAAGGVVLAVAQAISGGATSYPLLVFGVVIMNAVMGAAIPAMTTTIMQIAGRAHANSAASALNANRQIGALVGVALIGTILHSVPAWGDRLTLAFAAIALVYGLGAVLVYRFVAPPVKA